jgi:hypothetical protein
MMMICRRLHAEAQGGAVTQNRHANRKEKTKTEPEAPL